MAVGGSRSPSMETIFKILQSNQEVKEKINKRIEAMVKWLELGN